MKKQKLTFKKSTVANLKNSTETMCNHKDNMRYTQEYNASCIYGDCYTTFCVF